VADVRSVRWSSAPRKERRALQRDVKFWASEFPRHRAQKNQAARGAVRRRLARPEGRWRRVSLRRARQNTSGYKAKNSAIREGPGGAQLEAAPCSPRTRLHGSGAAGRGSGAHNAPAWAERSNRRSTEGPDAETPCRAQDRSNLTLARAELQHAAARGPQRWDVERKAVNGRAADLRGRRVTARAWRSPACLVGAPRRKRAATLHVFGARALPSLVTALGFSGLRGPANKLAHCARFFGPRAGRTYVTGEGHQGKVS